MSELVNSGVNDGKKGYFMQILNNLINNIISVSELSRGKASEIVQRVKDEKSHCVIVKNNKPAAVIMSIDEFSDTANKLKEYEDLKDALIDSYLISIAEERMETFDESKLISSDDMIKKYNLDVNRINELSKIVEIE